MLLQCTLNYPGLPDPRTLTMGEIETFYDFIRPLLRDWTKPAEKR